jgi:hypothetical protein
MTTKTSGRLSSGRQHEQAEIPIVLVLLSGRPTSINEALRKCDSFIAPGLPGREVWSRDVLIGLPANSRLPGRGRWRRFRLTSEDAN